MAKKKEVENNNTEIDFLADLQQDLVKKDMKFSKYANTELYKNTGIDAIDAILATNIDNIGFQLRTFNTLIGNTGAGKSTILTQIAANFIKDNNGKIIYYDSEHTTTLLRMESLGVDPKKALLIKEDTSLENFHKLMKSIESLRQKEKDKYGEDYVFENPIIVILDSIASLYSNIDVEASTEIQKGLGNNARIWTAIIKQHCDICRKYNVTVLSIQQSRDNISMGHLPPSKDLFYAKQSQKFSGGQALKFAAFYYMELKSKKIIDDLFGDQAIEVEFKMLKSKSSVANRPITLVFFPQKGYSNFHTNYKFLVDKSIIVNKGAYKSMPHYEKNFRGGEIEELYNTNEDFRLAFDKNVKEAYSTFIATTEKSYGMDEDTEVNFIGDADLNLNDMMDSNEMDISEEINSDN